MRRLTIISAILMVGSLVAFGQSQTYTNARAEYTLELPSATWRVTVEPDGAHQHTEFVYGDRSDGYLRIRKENLDPGLTVSEFARHDQEQKVRYLPGYINGKEERFAGRLNGVTMSYEFTQAKADGGTHLLPPGGQPHDLRRVLPARATSSVRSAIKLTTSRAASS